MGNATSEPEHRLHVDRVRSFATLGEVRAVSSAIVKVTTGDQSSGKIAEMPITVTQATVTKVVWGEIASGSDIEIRQLGFPGVVGNMSKIIESGKEYLVFLAPSTGADDAAPNRYLVAGDVGLYSCGVINAYSVAEICPPRVAARCQQTSTLPRRRPE